MKGSQVAGLAVGWLTVALSMAAIGAAAVGRVGVSSAESRVQITVAKPASQEKSASSLAPTNDPMAATSLQVAAYLPTASLAQYAKAVTTPRRSSAPPSAPTPPATVQSAPSTTTTLPTSAPPVTGPTKSLPTKRPSGDKNHTTSASPSSERTSSGSTSVEALSQSTGRRPDGAISAGCQVTAPTSVDPTRTPEPSPTTTPTPEPTLAPTPGPTPTSDIAG